ncbi:MAG: GAF domain-containing protein, partial [Chloroflexota bacterium]
LTSALASSRWSFLFFNFMMGVVVLLVATMNVTNLTVENFTFGLVVFAFGLIPLVIGVVARYFVQQLETIATQSQRSARLLSASADIGRSVSEMLDLEALLTRAAEIIRDRFAYYHVSIFLVDSNKQYANLTASTGEVGEQMLARSHRLSIDTGSVVGRSAQAQDVIVTRNAERDSGQAFNELLPDTRSEIGIPIVDNDGIVGVVDIQSRLPDAFTPTEIAALRVIANQLATAIRNARLFEDKERSIRENKRLFIEAETNLREIQRLNRQLTKDAWSDYLRGGRRVDGVTLTEEAFRNSADWTDEMLEASQKRRPMQVVQDGKQRIAVPIELRGEVVGAIELETNDRRSDDDIMDLVRSVSQRLAVTLDNARLFEESNMATAQEQQISEIVSQYQAADSVDDLLRLTLEGLSETLGADNASIRLGALEELTDVIDEFSDTEPDRATVFLTTDDSGEEIANGNGGDSSNSNGNGGQSV